MHILVEPPFGDPFVVQVEPLVAVNTVFGSILEPKIMGRRMGLSALVVFLSLVFWGWLLGIIGMFLAVPLTMIVKIMLDRSDDLRWIGILLGPAPDKNTTSNQSTDS